MMTLPEKFLDEAKKAGCKPTAVVGVVKEVLHAEALYKSHWDAALASSNIDTAAVVNEVLLAKTLASTGASQPAYNTNVSLLLGLQFRRLRGNGGYVWTDDTFIYFQSFTVPQTAFLDTIAIPFSVVYGSNNPSTLYIAITDANNVLLESIKDPLQFYSRVNPTATAPVASGGIVGNGSISTPQTSLGNTLTENFTVTCTTGGGANVAQFSVTGSVSGGVGTATSNVLFVSAGNKVRFTIAAGGVAWAIGDTFTFSTTDGVIIRNPLTNIVASLLDRNQKLEAGKEYKIFVTQSAVSQEDQGDWIFAFAQTGNPAPGALARAVNEGPPTFDMGGTDLAFTVTLANRYQPAGSISIKLNLGQTPLDPGEWVIEDVRDAGSGISYQAWSSATGAFAGEETPLGTIEDGQEITDLKQFYKITCSLTASADRLTSPRILKIQANFDIWDRYTLKDKFLEYKGEIFPPVVVDLPQLQYQMDILNGKATISQVSIDFADDGFLEETIVSYHLKNNECVIFLGFDADGWTFDDYVPFWRGNVANWKRKTNVITLDAADWAFLSKKEIPEENPATGAIVPIDYDGHPMDLGKDDLQNRINLRDSQIHFGSFDAAKNSPQLAGWRFKRTVSKPTDAWKLMQERNELCRAVLIPREDGKLYIYLFDPAAAHLEEFGDNELDKGSVSFDARMSTTLVNRATVYYGFHVPLILTGSATYTNNSAAVAGVGTQFLKELAVGMEIQGPDGRLYRVQSIASDTSFTMETVYAGVTAAGAAVKRPRTEQEDNPSSYQGSVVTVDAPSQQNYKQAIAKRILPSLWLGPDDGTYQGRQRAIDIGGRIVSLGKDGIPYAPAVTSLGFIALQVGDFIRLGTRTTLPRQLIGFTWTKWVIASKTIDFNGGKKIRWGMMKVPSGVAFSDELRAYSEWLEAATEVVNLVISQWPTEVILKFIDTEKNDKLDTEAEWNAYASATNLLIEA